MVENKSPLNLFSSKQKKQTPADSVQLTRRAHQPPQAQFDNDEVKQMLARIQEIKDDLSSKVESISARYHMSKEEIARYLQNLPGAKKALEEAELKQEMLAKKLRESAGIPAKAPKSSEELKKERKGKTLGSRRNWLPMH